MPLEDRFVILTVPHDAPPPVDRGHMRDLLAKQTAYELSSVLSDHGIESRVVVATIHRDKAYGGVDQNRVESRGSAFRRKIDEITIEQREAGKLVFVIDMHSFSDESDTNFGPAQVLVMDPTDALSRVATGYVRELIAFFRHKMSRGEAPSYIGGSLKNDIVVVAREMKAIAFLIESRERSALRHRDEVWNVLAEWIGDFSKKKSRSFSW
jgi:hypothetical protein